MNFLKSTQAKREEKWLAERRAQVLESLTSPASPLHGRPYIEGGRYEWYVESKISLDFFFPPERLGQRPLAVRVAGSHHVPYSLAKGSVPTRKFWEEACEEDFFVRDVCSRVEPPIPLLFVGPDDPIDPFSIAVKVKSLL